MTLTEQWKKGKLKEGKYYVKTQEDNLCELMFDDEGHWYDFGWDCWLGDDYVKEVLAPVPNYEEWERVKKYANKCEVEYIECANDYEKLKQENQQLKELLKECKTPIDLLIKMNIDGINGYKLLDLLTKIDNAIGGR